MFFFSFFQKDEQVMDSSVISSDNVADLNGIMDPERSKTDIDSLLVTEFEEVFNVSLPYFDWKC